ncbi:MAG TPA: ABC transporter ATP-binding protein [Mycobacteriales bacterium]|nr:ABC transporter ATP-binding protein [Mycobacteriales bacterium]
MTAAGAPPRPGRIVVDQLTKVFGGQVRAVDQLSFTVEPGSVTGFLGPNGAGKTTTLRMLLGLVTPTSGTATIGGQRYSHIKAPMRSVGAVLEAASFHPGRTARNHLRVYCTASGLPLSRADEALDMVGLRDSARRRVKGFSLGMRQRLGIACAMIGDPGVLILDEPANGLDPEGIQWLRKFMRHLASQGRTVLVSSHLLQEVEQTVNRVVILSRGRLVRQGTVDELRAGAGERVIVDGPDRQSLGHALAQARAQVQPTPDGPLQIVGLDARQVGHIAFASGLELHELRTERSDLEQIFFQLTAAAEAAPQGPPGSIPASTYGQQGGAR